MMRYKLALALVLALAACKGGEKETGGTAEGQILPGSASDAMIHYDQLTSQPPLAPRKAGPAEAADDTATDSASDAAAPDVDAPAVAAPVKTPTPTAVPTPAAKPQ
jgi:hypothetical protein